MFDYTRIGYEKVGETKTTASGMTQARYTKSGTNGPDTKIVSEFSETHPMRKKYGVVRTELSGYNGVKPRCYRLEADVFGQRIEFEPNLFDRNIKPNDQMAGMLKRLKKAAKYKLTPFVDNLANIAKYAKK